MPKYISILLLILIPLSVYFQSLENPFVLDDESQIVANEFIHNIQPLSFYFQNSTMNSGGSSKNDGLYYKPLMILSYAFLWNIGDQNVFYFHLFQLCLHILNGLFLYYLLQRFFKAPISFILALIFLVHPINAENVLHIANLQDVMYLFFGFIALTLALQFKEKEQSFFVKLVLLTFVSLFLLSALFCKESGILFFVPTALALTGLLNKNQSFYQAKKNWNWNWNWNFNQLLSPLIIPLIALAVPLVIYLIFRFDYAGLTYSDYKMVKIGEASLWTRMFTFPKIFTHYLNLFIYPYPLTLVEDWIVTQASWTDFYLPTLEMFGFFGLLFYFALKINTIYFYFWLVWYLIGIILHSQLVPLDGTVADRWFYFTIIGLLALIGQSYTFLITLNFKNNFWILLNKSKWILILFLIGGLSTLSFLRSLEWSSALKLYSIEVERQPQSFFLQNNLGVELFRAGQINNAIPHFIESTILKPDWSINWNNLGASYQHLGNLAEAKKNYQKSIENGNYYLAYENYGTILYLEKNYNALLIFLTQQALPKFPNNQKLNLLLKSIQK